jgi:hypothetical protein
VAIGGLVSFQSHCLAAVLSFPLLKQPVAGIKNSEVYSQYVHPSCVVASGLFHVAVYPRLVQIYQNFLLPQRIEAGDVSRQDKESQLQRIRNDSILVQVLRAIRFRSELCDCIRCAEGTPCRCTVSCPVPVGPGWHIHLQGVVRNESCRCCSTVWCHRMRQLCVSEVFVQQLLTDVFFGTVHCCSSFPVEDADAAVGIQTICNCEKRGRFQHSGKLGEYTSKLNGFDIATYSLQSHNRRLLQKCLQLLRRHTSDTIGPSSSTH